jgi:hypothetical protein
VSDAAATRASDADRERLAEALREHYAAGRLSAEELGERLSAAYQGATLQELEALRRDLPELPPSPALRRAERQRRQGELRRALLQRAGGAFTPFAIGTVIWLASGASSSFWPVWLLIFPALYLVGNLWRLHGPAPELDRVQRELEQRSPRRRRRHHRTLP